MRSLLLLFLLVFLSCRQRKSLDEQYPGISGSERQALDGLSAKLEPGDLEISKADTAQYVSEINARIDPQNTMVICQTVSGMDFQQKDVLDRRCSSIFIDFLKCLDSLKYDLIDVRLAQKTDSGRQIYGRVYLKVPTPHTTFYNEDDPPFVYGFWTTMNISEIGNSQNADCSSTVYTASPIYVEGGRINLMLFDKPGAFEPSRIEEKTDVRGSRYFVR